MADEAGIQVACENVVASSVLRVDQTFIVSLRESGLGLTQSVKSVYLPWNEFWCVV